MTKTKEICSDLLTDMSHTFFENYDYCNELYLDYQAEFEEEHGKELREEYGVNVTEFYNLFVKMYKDEWFTNLSNANEFLQTVYVIQDEPQPCTVLGMVINLDIGKGNTS